MYRGKGWMLLLPTTDNVIVKQINRKKKNNPRRRTGTPELILLVDPDNDALRGNKGSFCFIPYPLSSYNP